jgi:histidinol-phosphate aminotransferase
MVGFAMTYFRPNIERMHGYVPGEQPKIPGLIKLNTNENPYPPSPKVLAALREAIGDSLRLYPDPNWTALRQKIGQQYGFDPNEVIVANGSDETLSLATRAFVGEGEKLGYFWPSYSLYPVLGDIQGTQKVEFPLDEHFQIVAHTPLLHQLQDVKLLFVTNPNAPSGVWIQRVELQRVIEAMKGVVLIDEAYVDFCQENCLDFVREYPNVIVARTMSKSYSLAGMRIGYAFGSKELIAGLMKVKDSYNVNRLSQVAAIAAIEDQAHFRENVRKVIATRERVRQAMIDLGFFVYPSQANYLFAKPAKGKAADLYQFLREGRILVRYFSAPRVNEFIRISIGTDAEMDALLKRAQEWLK